MINTTGSHTFNVFGYGSLIFAPESPRRVLGMHPGRLDGYKRSFCKISRSRSCPRRESFDAFDDLPSRFRDNEHNRSLALGTIADPNSWIDGMVITYPKVVQSDIITTLDHREGYSAIRKIANNYIRRHHKIALLRTGGDVESIVYFWDEDPSGCNYIDNAVTLEERAKILINATPRQPDGPTDPLARGLYYMEGVRSALYKIQVLDQHLEALAQAVHNLPGPWTSVVAPPRQP